MKKPLTVGEVRDSLNALKQNQLFLDPRFWENVNPDFSAKLIKAIQKGSEAAKVVEANK